MNSTAGNEGSGDAAHDVATHGRIIEKMAADLKVGDRMRSPEGPPRRPFYKLTTVEQGDAGVTVGVGWGTCLLHPEELVSVAVPETTDQMVQRLADPNRYRNLDQLAKGAQPAWLSDEQVEELVGIEIDPELTPRYEVQEAARERLEELLTGFEIRLALGNADTLREGGVADILRKIADNVESSDETYRVVLDGNGQSVGFYAFTDGDEPLGRWPGGGPIALGDL